MRILIFGINYAPELTGIGKYTGEMAAWLAKKGNQVSVVTALPYYPEWNIHPEYKGKWWTKEFLNNVTLYRCPLYVPKQVTPVERIIHEFSFLLAILPVWIGILFQKNMTW
jgi:colanic acid biosynthesis glycosyl transferase WcaI